jgi:putative ABC transport system substrate-binding protein
VKRREFIVGLTGAASWPLVLRAQQGERVRRIGLLMAYPENDPEIHAQVGGFLQGLKLLGWMEGRNVQISYRYAGYEGDRLHAAAQELVALAPDVIVVQSNPAVVSLRQVNHTIPVVFVQVGDPVGSGFVDSLARPGGVLTGFTASETAIGGKWLELLKEIAPALRRTIAIYDPETAANVVYLREIEAAALIKEIVISAAAARDVAEVERVIVSSAGEPNVGLIVLPNPLTANNRVFIAALAIRYGLPSIGAFRYFVANGGLLSYGPDSIDLFRRAATYVDRILNGERPSDLPVQQPVKFELVVNMKTSKAIGLTVSDSFLLRADEVIE